MPRPTSSPRGPPVGRAARQSAGRHRQPRDGGRDRGRAGRRRRHRPAVPDGLRRTRAAGGPRVDGAVRPGGRAPIGPRGVGMTSYYRLGEVPAKRHVQFRAPDTGKLYAEELFGTEGFSGAYSILYHLGLPPQARTIEPLGSTEPVAWDVGVHRHHHLRIGGLAAGGDPIDGRVPLLFNDDVQISLCVPTEAQADFYRNGTHDELLFIHEG